MPCIGSSRVAGVVRFKYPSYVFAVSLIHYSFPEYSK